MIHKSSYKIHNRCEDSYFTKVLLNLPSYHTILHDQAVRFNQRSWKVA